MTVPLNLACPPIAVAVDLGSRTVGVWAARRGTVGGSCGDAFTSAATLVRRGRVVDVEGCTVLLSQLVSQYPEPVPAGAVVVACRPVLASEADQAAMQRIVDAVFRPTRLLFIDTVRAAAVGSGAAAGTLLIADVGAELTEIAVLKDGRVVTARRADIGTRDLTHGAPVDRLSGIVAGHVQELRRSPVASDLAVAMRRGLLLVGDGASHPDLAVSLSSRLRLQVHRAAAPRTAAINGAGLAAMAALRHPAAV